MWPIGLTKRVSTLPIALICYNLGLIFGWSEGRVWENLLAKKSTFAFSNLFTAWTLTYENLVDRILGLFHSNRMGKGGKGWGPEAIHQEGKEYTPDRYALSIKNPLYQREHITGFLHSHPKQPFHVTYSQSRCNFVIAWHQPHPHWYSNGKGVGKGGSNPPGRQGTTPPCVFLYSNDK